MAASENFHGHAISGIKLVVQYRAETCPASKLFKNIPTNHLYTFTKSSVTQ